MPKEIAGDIGWKYKKLRERPSSLNTKNTEKAEIISPAEGVEENISLVSHPGHTNNPLPQAMGAYTEEKESTKPLTLRDLSLIILLMR